MLYWVFSPASVVVDIVRVSATGHVRGRGWLVLFVILQMLSKVRLADSGVKSDIVSIVFIKTLLPRLNAECMVCAQYKWL